MMESVLIAAVSAVQAYLLGSIDTGILVSKFLYHDDVRKYGSGAAGMTNMLRTFGKKAAALTAFGDVLKGVPPLKPKYRGFKWPIMAKMAARACWWRAAPFWPSSRC